MFLLATQLATATADAAPPPVSFAPAVQYPLPSSVGSVHQRVAVGALRGGQVDDVVVGTTNGNVDVYLNQGEGTFAPGVEYATGGASVAAIAVADVNGDGHPDVIATVVGRGAGIYIFLGDGHGGLQAPYPVLNYDGGSGDSPTALAVGDFFHNGRVSLAVGYTPGGANGDVIRIFSNDGKGDFTLSSTIGVGNTYTSVFWLTTGYLRNDITPDLVASITGNGVTGCGGVQIYLNDGTGEFSGAGALKGLCSEERPVATADFNHDGHTDIAAGTDSASGERIYFGAGDGTFPTSSDIPLAAGYPGSTVAADLNGDGYPDLATTCKSACSAAMQALIGNGDGTFASGPILSGDNDDLAVGGFTSACGGDVASVGYSLTILLNTSPYAGSCGRDCANVPSSFPPLKKVLSGHISFKRGISVGPIALGVYANARLQSASLCVSNNIAIDPTNGLRFAPPPPSNIDLTAQATASGVDPTPRVFSYDVLHGWNYDPRRPAWSLTPAVQPFTLDWSTFNIQAYPGNLTYSPNDDSKPTVSSDLVQVKGPTLNTQLISDPTQGLSLWALFQPGATLGVSVAPSSIRVPCYLEASTFLFNLLVPNYDLLLAAGTAQATVSSTRSSVSAIIGQFPKLVNATRAAANGMENAAYLYVFNSCLSAIRAVERGVGIVAVGVVVVVGAVVVTTAVASVLGPAAGVLVGTLVVVPALRAAAARQVPVAVPAASRLQRLRVHRLRLRSIRGLRAAPLRRAEVAPFVRALQTIPVTAKVGRLVIVGGRRFRAGAQIGVLAAALPRRTHRAILVVRGPGYEGEALLKVNHGLAGASLILPRTVRRGLWAIAVIDNANLRLVPHLHGLRGIAQIRLGVFHVNAATHA